ncbi:MAG TPA: extensin family protein [Kofleriaceae bacterium]|nr:extensin family protein [Kofleriaceae bacterium]
MVRLAGFMIAIGCAVVFACALAAPAGAKPASSASKSAKKRARRHDSSAAARITNPHDAEDTPAVRYARLSQGDCEAELAQRHIEFVREAATGVMAPVRLTGPLHGVVFRTDGKDAVRATSPYEIADCRLVLALDDFAQILESHDIVEVRHYSMYRPPRHWPEDKIGSQHDGALALDAGRFIDRAGKVLDVDHDFHGRIGARTCGDGAAPRPATPDALTLREILCQAVERRLFNVVLTPNYNRPHHNHFHLEVMAGVGWFLVH